jgi:hypothetical protein
VSLWDYVMVASDRAATASAAVGHDVAIPQAAGVAQVRPPARPARPRARPACLPARPACLPVCPPLSRFLDFSSNLPRLARAKRSPPTALHPPLPPENRTPAPLAPLRRATRRLATLAWPKTATPLRGTCVISDGKLPRRSQRRLGQFQCTSRRQY